MTETNTPPTVSIVVPTYCREQVLLDTLGQLLTQDPPALEILVMDQTEQHETATETLLQELSHTNRIRWIRLGKPSIPAAMNQALLQAQSELVLFVDDDVTVDPSLVTNHARAHRQSGAAAVVGQIIQPWEQPLVPGEDPFRGGRHNEPDAFRFNAADRHWIHRVMAGNLSVRRDLAIAVGGFDENFVKAAYRFEAEFADRLGTHGHRILFEPSASLHHLKAERGGTREYRLPWTTVKPDHAVGEYYYLFRANHVPQRLWKILRHPFRAVTTRYHLRHPWRIPATLIAEFLGMLWALALLRRGPGLIKPEAALERNHA